MSSQSNFPEQQDEIEIQLAYWLENSTTEDTQTISAFIERYGQQVYRFAMILLAGAPLGDEINRMAAELTNQLFSEAFNNPMAFRGAPSISSWLLRMLTELHNTWRWRLRRLLGLLKASSQSRHDPKNVLPDAKHEIEKSWIHELPKMERLALVLSFGMGLTNAEIVYVLSIRPQRFDTILLQAISSAHQGLAEKLEADEQEFADIIADSIDEAWQVPSVDDLTAGFESSHRSRSSRKYVAFAKQTQRFREISFILFITLIVAVITWYFSQTDHFRGKPLYDGIPEATPTAIAIPNIPVQDAPEVSAEAFEFSYHIAPQISADGRWLVFNRVDQLESSSIWLFDSYTGASLHIDHPYEENAVGSSYGPRISEDGRWIVFYSDNPWLTRGEMAACRWRDQDIDCLDVFLYDRELGTLQRISQQSDDQAADGHSFFASISPDGRMIAFWSAATNLVEGDHDTCGAGYKAHPCWDVYLYDRLDGSLTRLPIGRSFDMVDVIRIYPISLSNGGKRLALTIHESDLIADELELTSSSEVFIYDRESQSWAGVADISDQSAGTGSSYLPELTNDGRYVAFVSLADQLVPEDDNGVADVFVRDLDSGVIELISKSNQGEPGNDHSGILPEDTIMWGEQLGFSADGRYITFISKATNLMTPPGKGCVASQFSYCSDVYVHDRVTGETTALITQPRGDGFYIFPGISSDGSLLYFVQFHLNCNQAPYCANILFYERSTAHITSPLRGDLPTDAEQAGVWRTTRFLETPDAGGVHDLAFTPTGEELIAGLRNGSVWVWDMPDGTNPRILKMHKGLVDQVSIDPAGEVFASGSHDGSVILWSASDGSMMRRIAGNEGAIFDMAFFSKGRYLAIAAQRAAWIWDVRDLVFGILDYIEYPGEQVRAVAISPDEKLLAHGLGDGSLWLRSLPDMVLIVRIAAHDEMITSLVFSPDGRYLASGSGDNRVILWELSRGRGESWRLDPVIAFQNADWVNDLAFSPDGRWLGVAAYRGNIQLWSLDRAGGDDVTLNADGFQPLSIAFSPDGRWLAAGSSWGGVRLWELTNPGSGENSR